MSNVSGVKSKTVVFGTDTDAISAAATATTLALLNSGPWVNLTGRFKWLIQLQVLILLIRT
jgi:hypothetical protein